MSVNGIGSSGYFGASAYVASQMAPDDTSTNGTSTDGTSTEGDSWTSVPPPPSSNSTKEGGSGNSLGGMDTSACGTTRALANVDSSADFGVLQQALMQVVNLTQPGATANPLLGSLS